MTSDNISDTPSNAADNDQTSRGVQGEADVNVRGDAGLVSGAVLIGGATLLYDIGKDFFSRSKPGKKIFLQVVDSSYADQEHRLKVRVASTYVHGIYVEAISSHAVKGKTLQVSRERQRDIGIGSRNDESRNVFPLYLAPSAAIDLLISFEEIGDYSVVQNRGMHMKLLISALDKLGDPEEYEEPVRLRWS